MCVLQMNYGNLTDFWQRFGVFVGDDSGRDGESSGSMVADLGGEPSTSGVQGEVTRNPTEMEQKLQELVGRFVSSLEKKNWKDSGYYISDVYGCESPERAAGMAKRLAERAESFRRGLIGIFVHGNHVHTIHSCPYTKQSCRCYFKNFPEAKEDIRRLLRRPPAIETFTGRDWENITIYFCTKGRRATYFKVFGAHQRIPFEITALSDTEIPEHDELREGEESGLENCRDPLELLRGSEGADIPAHPRAAKRRKRRNPVVAGGDGGIGGATGIIYELLSKCAVCPLTEIVYTTQYLSNAAVACKRLNSKEVQDAIDTRASVLNTWKREDFVKFYNDPTTIKIWSARHLDEFDNYYMSYEDSVNVTNLLLAFQCNDVGAFCRDVVDTLDCNVPKRNCLVIVSPPSAGKNFMFDAIRDYFLNTGQMHNPNKYNQFAYQDCHNRRLLIWNEPNYEPRESENLKMLFAGDNLSVNVKCKPQANVKRTGVIVLSNHIPHFVKQSAFMDRVISYQWSAAPFLKDYSQKPRPDAVVDTIYSYAQ